LNQRIKQTLSGPSLVSRTGDVGWTKRRDKVPKEICSFKIP